MWKVFTHKIQGVGFLDDGGLWASSQILKINTPKSIICFFF